MAQHTDFTTIRTEGALLPPDLLRRIRDNDTQLPGLNTDAYHLVGHTRISEAISEAWNKLQGTWATFQAARSTVPVDAPGTTVTRDRWLLPLFQVLDYGRLQTTTARELNGKTYPISHAWSHVPIHLVGCNVDLDQRTAGVAGAARQSPHGLVQAYLNASEESLWGIVSNGLKVRLLRDSRALTRQTYLEFDLEAMLSGEAYSDFVLLYLTLHQSRLEADRPENTILEQWTQAAQEQGTRALDRLRDGVERALGTLGQGFLEHPANQDLRNALKNGTLTPQDYYRQLLRVVYRFLVVFAAEDRDLLHPPESTPEERERYSYYSTRRLRELADAIPGGRHPDQYELLKQVWRWLGGEGVPDLAIPALGGFLFREENTPSLNSAALSNRALLTAIRYLAFTQANNARYPIDYKNLGAEELGSVYESLLELHPLLDADSGQFSLETLGGNERKTTGSYYTPSSLIGLLLDSALDPVLDEAARQENPEKAILDLKVVDPASGSGHFLIAAAHRIAHHLARVRTGEEEPTPQATRQALRDTIANCIYGVDLNDMASELCKVALWLEALEPGKPLSFLDHHIKSGNSLMGAPFQKSISQLVQDGIPDEAYVALPGDDRALTNASKRRNKEERGGQHRLFGNIAAGPDTELADALRKLQGSPINTIEDARAKEAAFHALESENAYARAHAIANAWTAAFLWPKNTGEPAPITSHDLHTLDADGEIGSARSEVIDQLRQRHRFFHWRLEFADVFHRDKPGFDVILGNPPWDQVQFDPQEFFAASRPDIANAANMTARNRKIGKLGTEDPALYLQFERGIRAIKETQHFLHTSGRFPLTTRGRLNLAPLFAEATLSLLQPGGMAGIIVPSGIATDSFTQHFFRTITEGLCLVSLYDFENRRKLFPAVDSRMKFSLLSLSGPDKPTAEPWYVFFAHQPSDVQDPNKRFVLTPRDIALINPNTRTAPTFRSQRDAEITKRIYERFPVLINDGTGENPWGITLKLMFMMNTDSDKFRTRRQLEEQGYELQGNLFRRSNATSPTFLPLYEGKMIHHFDHRFATYEESGRIRDVTAEEHSDPTFAPMPRYWVEDSEVEERLVKRDSDGNVTWKWTAPWLLGFRDIARSTDERTAIFSLIPRVAAGNKLPLFLPASQDSEEALLLLAITSSFVFDYVVRQSVGGTTLNFYIVKQLPFPRPAEVPTELRRRLVELGRLLAITDDVFITTLGQPPGGDLRWDSSMRNDWLIELNALCMRLYGVSSADAAHIMDTFEVLCRRERVRDGEFATREAILNMLAGT